PWLSAILIRRRRPRWPGMLIAMVLGSGFCYGINGAAHGVPLIGAMTGQLPPLSAPAFSLDVMQKLAPGAIAVAIIALVEAVSIARSVAKIGRASCRERVQSGELHVRVERKKHERREDKRAGGTRR